MADPQNVEIMQDPKGPPPANANGVETEHQGDDEAPDPKLLKAEIDKLKKQLGTVLNEKKRETEAKRALSEKLKGWADLEEETGLSLEQAREMAKAREEHELGEAKSKGDVEKLIANRDQHWTKIVGKKDEERNALIATMTKLRDTIHEITVDRELREEIAKVVEPAFVNAVFALLRGKAKGVEDEDVPYGVRPAMAVGDDDMPIKDFIKQWAEADPDAQAFLIGNRSQGGGAPASSKSAGGIPRMKRSQMTAKQKSDFMTAYGIDRYNSLPM
jgi:hypothetical protein